jgi:molecular chaperone DnaK (HSP70)
MAEKNVGDGPAKEEGDRLEPAAPESAAAEKPAKEAGAGSVTPPAPRKTPPKAGPAKPTGQTDEPQARPQLKRLAKSIGMAMPNNRFRVFLGRGAIPPVSEKKHFVARLRRRDRVEVIVLEGDSELANENKFVGEAGLTNVTLREDGRAEVEIEFALDDKGYLAVTLVDRLSGTEGIARFQPPQFVTELEGEADLSNLPATELSQKIDLLEQQMQLLKGELAVRKAREE